MENGVAAVTGRMLALLPAPRAAAPTEGPVTIDLETTDVKVYASKKRGVAYNYRGWAGRPHAATRAQTETVSAADHGCGIGRVALRADVGYFAVSWPEPPTTSTSPSP